ncbi:MAG: fibronectin type III domain-containing protein [Fibrobacteria bacterium]|nr:fibronectin type III domain-containing protein [Fibrobacteria bacterium]
MNSEQMLKKLTIKFLIIALSVLAGCLPGVLEESSTKNPKATIEIQPVVLFKSNGIAIAPDSVEIMVFTVKYGNISITESFPYNAHSGTIRNIPINVPFTIKVEGKDISGNVIFTGLEEHVGDTKNISITITAEDVSPKPPSALKLTALSSSSIQIEWTDNSNNELGFIIERSVNDTVYTPVDTTIANLTGTVDSKNLQPSSIYYYRIAGFNASGKTSYLSSKAIKTLSLIKKDTMPPVVVYTNVPSRHPYSLLTIRGTVTDSSGVFALISGENSAQINIDSTFELSVPLSTGPNVIIIKATDKSPQNNTKSDTLNVTFDQSLSDTIPPVIKVMQPANGSIVYALSKTITGTVVDDGGIKVFIVNGDTVIPDSLHNWSTVVTFTGEGLQTVRLIAIDSSDVMARDSITLTVNTSVEDTTKPVVTFLDLHTNALTVSSTQLIRVSINKTNLESVLINNQPAAYSGNVWSYTVSLTSDTNTIMVVAIDSLGNQGSNSIKLILNRPPQIHKTPETRPISINVEYKDTVQASDEDGDSIYYFMESGVEFMQIGLYSGEITWTPTDTGIVRCTVYVVSKYDYSDTTIWSLRVYDSTTVIEPPGKVVLDAPDNVTDTSMLLIWSKSDEEGFSSYEVSVATISDSVLFIEKIDDQNVTTYLVTGLQEQTTYLFTVKVLVDGANSVSNKVSAKTLATPVHLSYPDSIQANSVILNWTKSTSDDFVSYKVYYLTSHDTTLVDTINDINTVQYAVSGLMEVTIYNFWVSVHDSTSDVLSNVVSATTLAIPPGKITLYSDPYHSDTSITLVWSKAQDADFISYKIYYSTKSSVITPETSLFIDSITVANDTSYLITILEDNTIYYFKIFVFDSDTYTGSDSIKIRTFDTVIDPRDNNHYSAKFLGGRMWMRENLRYKPESSTTWCPDSSGSGSNEENCDEYGRLYDWNTATADDHVNGNGKDICPPGWFLPSDDDWQDVEQEAGITQSITWQFGVRGSPVGKYFKSKIMGGNDLLDFTVYATGGYVDSYLTGFGSESYFWTATEAVTDSAYARQFSTSHDGIGRIGWKKADGASVRCVSY